MFVYFSGVDIFFLEFLFFFFLTVRLLELLPVQGDSAW